MDQTGVALCRRTRVFTSCYNNTVYYTNTVKYIIYIYGSSCNQFVQINKTESVTSLTVTWRDAWNQDGEASKQAHVELCNRHLVSEAS